MKGWVYMISNKSMPGLIKVGYSSKDPELRALDLSGTGSPHSYVVEYEVLIENPERIEGMVHRSLSEYHEAKEWFRCSVERGISAIRNVASGKIINETIKYADPKNIERLTKKQNVEDAIREARETTVWELEKRIKEKYDMRLQTDFPERALWRIWIASSSISFFAGLFIALLFYEKNFEEFLFPTWLVISAIGGGIVASFLKPHFEEKDKNSNAYKAINEKREEELEAVRNGTADTAAVLKCPNCQETVDIDRSLFEKYKDKDILNLQHKRCSGSFKCQKRGDVVIDPTAVSTKYGLKQKTEKHGDAPTDRTLENYLKAQSKRRFNT